MASLVAFSFNCEIKNIISFVRELGIIVKGVSISKIFQCEFWPCNKHSGILLGIGNFPLTHFLTLLN